MATPDTTHEDVLQEQEQDGWTVSDDQICGEELIIGEDVILVSTEGSED